MKRFKGLIRAAVLLSAVSLVAGLICYQSGLIARPRPNVIKFKMDPDGTRWEFIASS